MRHQAEGREGKEKIFVSITKKNFFIPKKSRNFYLILLNCI
jgi:hypothetical protein